MITRDVLNAPAFVSGRPSSYIAFRRNIADASQRLVGGEFGALFVGDGLDAGDELLRFAFGAGFELSALGVNRLNCRAMLSAFDAWSFRPNSFAFLAYISKVLGFIVNPQLGGCFVPFRAFAGFVDAGIMQSPSLLLSFAKPILPTNAA